MYQLKLTTAMAFLCMALISCQKEVSEEVVSGGGAGSGSITGNYQFVSIESKSVATVTLSDGTDVLKTVTYNEYLTKNTTGTVKIDASSMSTTNLSYSIESMARGYTYINNVLEDSVDVPFNFNLPPTASTSTYKLVGSDSITYTSGSVLVGSNPQVNSTPSGARYKIEGSNLYFYQNVDQTTTREVQGIPVQTKSLAKVTIHLRKQ